MSKKKPLFLKILLEKEQISDETLLKWCIKNSPEFWRKHSVELATKFSHNFDIWFNKDTFNYELGSSALCHHCPFAIEKWFDKTKFNYKEGSKFLVDVAYTQKFPFEKWFDKSKFVYTYVSLTSLLQYFPDKITLWWDDCIYNSEDDLWLALVSQSHYLKNPAMIDNFDIWWRPELIKYPSVVKAISEAKVPLNKWFNGLNDFPASVYLTCLSTNYKDEFDVWFDADFLSDRLDIIKNLNLLPLHHSDKFNKWWPVFTKNEHLRFIKELISLPNACARYFNMWKDYVAYFSPAMIKYNIQQFPDKFNEWCHSDFKIDADNFITLLDSQVAHVDAWWNEELIRELYVDASSYEVVAHQIHDIFMTKYKDHIEKWWPILKDNLISVDLKTLIKLHHDRIDVWFNDVVSFCENSVFREVIKASLFGSFVKYAINSIDIWGDWYGGATVVKKIILTYDIDFLYERSENCTFKIER